MQDGCDTAVAAPGRVSIKGSWRVSKKAIVDQDGDEELALTYLVEMVTVTCPSVFAPFIRGNIGLNSWGDGGQVCGDMGGETQYSV